MTLNGTMRRHYWGLFQSWIRHHVNSGHPSLGLSDVFLVINVNKLVRKQLNQWLCEMVQGSCEIIVVDYMIQTQSSRNGMSSLGDFTQITRQWNENNAIILMQMHLNLCLPQTDIHYILLCTRHTYISPFTGIYTGGISIRKYEWLDLISAKRFVRSGDLHPQHKQPITLITLNDIKMPAIY